MTSVFGMIQNLGRSLMLPIAVLPIAGLLLRLGQPDLLDLPYVAAAGDAVFSNLGLLFAVGVAVGLAREANGAAGLAAIVAYLVTTEGAKVLIAVPPDVLAGAASGAIESLSSDYRAEAISRLSVPAGLLCGILAGWLYNRYANIRLPEYLAFFAGRRFVPIVSGFAALVLAALFGYGWPLVQSGMDTLSHGVIEAGEVGLFGYGLLNRILIVTGMHHILNNIAWFIIGDFEGTTGDLRRFFADDPSAGAFMSGFFPVMMFGLPAACLAMYRAAAKPRRAAVGGLLFSMALTSFLTGITEPIEFTFMFLAPALYAIHAVLTGVSMVVMDFLGIRLGFGFSAGFFDYVLNFSRATRPLWMLPVGVAYFAVYYFTFRFFIAWRDVKTPGRDDGAQAAEKEEQGPAAGDDVMPLVAALGGDDNLTGIDACTTRLRLTVKSQDLVDEARLKSLGAAGVLRTGKHALQVVIGLRADEIAAAMRKRLAHAAVPTADTPLAGSDGDAWTPSNGELEGLVEALGGRANLRAVETAGTRLLLEVADATAIDEEAVRKLGLRGVAFVAARRVQVLGACAMRDAAARLTA